ncbi:MAG: hypothetical protein Q9161_004727 [Pseudevernia consocians]
MIQTLGYKSATSADVMTVPPYAFAFSYNSDRFRDRGLDITGVCIAVATVYATYAPTPAWAAHNLGNSTKRALMLGMYTAIGNYHSVVGTYIYPSTSAPRFRKGHYPCFGMSHATAVLTFANHVVLGRVTRGRLGRGWGREWM